MGVAGAIIGGVVLAQLAVLAFCWRCRTGTPPEDDPGVPVDLWFQRDFEE